MAELKEQNITTCVSHKCENRGSSAGDWQIAIDRANRKHRRGLDLAMAHIAQVKVVDKL